MSSNVSNIDSNLEQNDINNETSNLESVINNINKTDSKSNISNLIDSSKDINNNINNNKMKQFSLKEYLKNPNQKVVTRNGEKVRIICTDRKIEHFPIVALCTSTITGQETCRSYGINGNYNAYDQSVLDLMFAPQKHEYWINVYKNTNVRA